MSSVVTGNEAFDVAVRSLIDEEDCELPVLPEVATQLLRMTGDVDCEIGDIVALIKRDQSLTSHLLRIANSLRYSTGVTVSSVQQAVARLGLISVREITVLISCQCKVFDVVGFENEIRQSFRRSLAVAAFSQEIARERRMNVEEAFLAGLLHDVGRPVLLQALSDRRRKRLFSATDSEVALAASENRIQMATRLIRTWDLSPRIAEAVQHQGQPEAAPNCVMQAATLNLAISLAQSLLDHGPALAAEEAHPMIAVLNLYPEQFHVILRNQNLILEWVGSIS
ncbi:MAG: HDOD domain-containing protein [Planctomycetota bacterium]